MNKAYLGKKYNKVMFVDIDGTLCEDIPNEDWTRMPSAKPLIDNIKQIAEWKDAGFYICIFTSRTEELRMITEQWLSRYGFPYDKLIMNKPRVAEGGEYYFIDNNKARGITLKNGKVTNLVSATKEILVFEE